MYFTQAQDVIGMTAELNTTILDVSARPFFIRAAGADVMS